MQRHRSLVLTLLIAFVASLLPASSQAATPTPLYLPFVSNAAP